eukprot:gnl/MRDRNA2_/MRDRNA2_102434_c0_seq1.p1 gnl/MRDRNA2_/MRDRNA2_102434_c0~~gnl/MRDRNA2_/MRDRNA2_102434_c0_seq1.p1  ORF type:complete len:150 (-),score=22.92 gnl/MRDRNA2_/MRDRNA2_102434_c0_seq1:121-570(-)
MTWTVGPEKLPQAQRDAAWRSRVGQEDGGKSSRRCCYTPRNKCNPITGELHCISEDGSAPPGTAGSRRLFTGNLHGGFADTCISQSRQGSSRVPTASSCRSSPSESFSSVPSCAVRSSVLSLELHFEKERRAKAEEELAKLKEQLATYL